MTKDIFKKILWLNIIVIIISTYKYIVFPYVFALEELSNFVIKIEEKYPSSGFFYQTYVVAYFIILIFAYIFLFKFKDYGRKLFLISAMSGVLFSFVDKNTHFFFDSLDYAILLLNVMLDGFIISIIYFSNISKNFKSNYKN